MDYKIIMNISHLLQCGVLLATTATSLLLLGCSGCATHEQKNTSTAQEAQKHEAAQWHLSPGAKITYAYLRYEQALRKDDASALLSTLQDLSYFDPPASTYVDVGVWFMGRGSVDILPILAKGTQRYPNDISLHLLYAELLQEVGQEQKAIAHMRNFIQLHPDNTDAQLELALLLVTTNANAEATKILNNFTGKQRTAIVDYYHAKALLGLHQNTQAIHYLQSAIKKMPEFIEATADLAHVYEQQGKFQEARALYEIILRRYQGSAEVLVRLVSLSLRLNEPQKAFVYYKESSATPAAAMTVAAMFLEQKQYNLAESILRDLIALSDPPQELYFYLAIIAYEGQKDFAKAHAWLEKVPPSNIAYARALSLRVQLLVDMNKLPQALETARIGQKALPEEQEFYTMEVRLLATIGDYAAAVPKAQILIEKWPNDVNIAFLRASLLDESGDKKAALQAMEDIIVKNPEHYQALNYIGYALAEENRDIERALILLHKAVELAPDSDYILDSLAWAFYKAGNTQEAWRIINNVLKLTTNLEPTIWEHYGDIAKALGKTNEARKGYTKALEKNPENASSLKERLLQL